jgi:zinc transporter 9
MLNCCLQWLAPNEFSYKAEVDFDGTYLAAKLMEDYEAAFLDVKGCYSPDLSPSLLRTHI